MEFGPRKHLTSGAEWTIVRCVSAVAGVSIVLLHTLPSVPAVHPKTGAVALASGLDPRSDLCSLFQVKGNAVHPQGSDAAQKPSLSPCSA